MYKIEPQQIKRIFGNAKGRGLDNEQLHEYIYTMTGKDSIRKLTKAQAETVINELKGKRKTRTAMGAGGEGMATEKQKKLLFALMYELDRVDPQTGGAADRGDRVRVRLEGLAKKIFRRDRLEWLTTKEAASMAEAIKRMLRGKEYGNLQNTTSTANQREA